MKHTKGDAAEQSQDCQSDDLGYCLTHNEPIKHRLLPQLVADGDEINDSTKVWPETNEFVKVGEIVVDLLSTMDEGKLSVCRQKGIVYDLKPRHSDGIDASDETLIEVRTAVYQISVKIRREHLDEEVQQAVK